MRPFFENEVGVDQRHDPSAQRLILIVVLGVEDLEPHFKIKVANENGRILLVTFFQAVQEPALIRIWVFCLDTGIEALDEILSRP